MLGTLELRLAIVRSCVVRGEIADRLGVRSDVVVIHMLDKGVVVREVRADEAVRLDDDSRL
eukprot:6208964-Pleurochrysis_carterae.AAC.1